MFGMEIPHSSFSTRSGALDLTIHLIKELLEVNFNLIDDMVVHPKMWNLMYGTK